ncbi:MAG: DUF4282 domain-containing protein [Firmicutes bacterium]|nr:DUF4282 domain-containing protein [Bacillota bacterium]
MRPGGFFSFQKMISGTLIKVLYIVGLLVLTIGGLVRIIQGISAESLPNLAEGLGVIILGNLFWRMACEGMIVIFSIHDAVIKIYQNTKRD